MQIQFQEQWVQSMSGEVESLTFGNGSISNQVGIVDPIFSEQALPMLKILGHMQPATAAEINGAVRREFVCSQVFRALGDVALRQPFFHGSLLAGRNASRDAPSPSVLVEAFSTFIPGSLNASQQFSEHVPIGCLQDCLTTGQVSNVALADRTVLNCSRGLAPVNVFLDTASESVRMHAQVDQWQALGQIGTQLQGSSAFDRVEIQIQNIGENSKPILQADVLTRSNSPNESTETAILSNTLGQTSTVWSASIDARNHTTVRPCSNHECSGFPAHGKLQVISANEGPRSALNRDGYRTLASSALSKSISSDLQRTNFALSKPFTGTISVPIGDGNGIRIECYAVAESGSLSQLIDPWTTVINSRCGSLQEPEFAQDASCSKLILAMIILQGAIEAGVPSGANKIGMSHLSVHEQSRLPFGLPGGPSQTNTTFWYSWVEALGSSPSRMSPMQLATQVLIPAKLALDPMPQLWPGSIWLEDSSPKLRLQTPQSLLVGFDSIQTSPPAVFIGAGASPLEVVYLSMPSIRISVQIQSASLATDIAILQQSAAFAVGARPMFAQVQALQPIGTNSTCLQGVMERTDYANKTTCGQNIAAWQCAYSSFASCASTWRFDMSVGLLSSHLNLTWLESSLRPENPLRITPSDTDRFTENATIAAISYQASPSETNLVDEIQWPIVCQLLLN